MGTEPRPQQQSQMTDGFVDIVFDGPPSHESGRFVEVENELRQSIAFGEWVERDDGYWCLRVPTIDAIRARCSALEYGRNVFAEGSERAVLPRELREEED